MVTVTVHDIGRADDPSATVSTSHADGGAALSWLHAQYGEQLHVSSATSGTIGFPTAGGTFQASKTWEIR